MATDPNSLRDAIDAATLLRPQQVDAVERAVLEWLQGRRDDLAQAVANTYKVHDGDAMVMPSDRHRVSAILAALGVTGEHRETQPVESGDDG
jgi:hypothetical protein